MSGVLKHYPKSEQRSDAVVEEDNEQPAQYETPCN